MSSSDDDSEETPMHAEYKAQGNEAYKEKDYRRASALYTLAIEDAQERLEEGGDDADVELRSLLASYYGNRAAASTMILKYEEALEDCNKAIQADSKFVKAHFRKAKILTTLGRLDDAIKAYSYGLVHDPNNASIVQEKANVETIQKRFDLTAELLKSENDSKKRARQSLLQMEAVLKSCPMWKEAMLQKMDCLVRLGRTDEAYALSTKLMRMGMDNAELIFLRSKCLFYQGALDDAMKHLRQILSGDPDNKKAFQLVKQIRSLKKKKQQADDAYKARNYKEAVKQYGQAIELCPADNAPYRAKLFFNRALSYNGLRQHEECVADCTRALSLNDQYIKALHRRAASNLLIGGKQECTQAVADYEVLVDLVATDEERHEIRNKLRSAKIQLKRSGRKDLYKILGVNRDATEAEIKKTYRKQALKYHPDRQKGKAEQEKTEAEAKFREINLAHEILSDPEKKHRYDEGVDEQDIDDPSARPGGGHGGFGGGMGGFDQEVLFEMFMRQQYGGGGGGFHFG